MDVRIFEDNMSKALQKCFASKAMKIIKVNEEFLNFDIDSYIQENMPF